ncbi:hypothetical protein OPV22_005103 [Ensete ventricosum]|uniref:Uncharacterized protein n=1 Tax=Ensete ventricosum TaxID=4639 RepID=A0AAV8Q863_ENSVE|nr:hypothetical protein OPV22_005103 [Ensete ventricosum]
MKKKYNSEREQPLTQSNYYSTKFIRNMNSSRDFIWTLGRPFKEVAGHVGQEEEARRGLEVVALEGRRVELGRAQEAAVDRAVQEDAAVVQREVEDREPAVPWAGQDLGVLHHAGEWTRRWGVLSNLQVMAIFFSVK